MADAQMTHLDRGFFWLQFKAGPNYRFVPLVIFGLLFMFAGPLLSPLTAALSTVVTVPVFFYSLFPEVTALQALGMNRARASRLLLGAIVPAVVVPAAVCLAYNPNLIGLLGAAIATAVGAVLYFVAMPNDADPVVYESKEGRTVAWSSSFALFWRRNIVWAVAAGAFTGVLIPVSSLINVDFLRVLVAALPTLALWMRVVSSDELRAATSQSLGLTRRQWLRTGVGVVVAVNAIYALTGVATAALTNLIIPTAASPVAAILYAAVMGLAACLLGLSGHVSWDGFAFVGPLMFWIPLRYPMDPHDPVAISEMAILGGIQAAIAVVLAAFLLWRYAAGRSNAPRASWIGL